MIQKKSDEFDLNEKYIKIQKNEDIEIDVNDYNNSLDNVCYSFS